MRALLLEFVLSHIAGVAQGLSPFGGSTERAWKDLSESVQGRAHALYPWEKVCFTEGSGNISKSAQCEQVQDNYFNRTYRAGQPGAYMIPSWEACQTTDQQCMLDASNLNNPLVFNTTCSQGSVPLAYVDAQDVEDVMAALKFCKITGVPLVVKNTGHDFKGRSSASGSLSIWTHHMNDISFNESFQPEGCHDRAFRAVTVQAGARWRQVYDFSDKHNFDVLGGTDVTVGAAGGWLQGGGHGFLSTTMGLGIDRVLQMRVVTADGQLRVANSCQNSDLFWALRGGGGGTFGVVVEATHLVEERKPVQTFILVLEAGDQTIRSLWSTYITNAERWAKQGWGGLIEANVVVLVNRALNSTEAVESMEPFMSLARSDDVKVINQVQSEFPSWTFVYNTFLAPNPSPIGIPAALSSRLIPVDNFRGAAAQEELLEALLATEESTPGIQMYAVTPYSSPFSANDVSATPAWRHSLLHTIAATGWAWNSSSSDVRAQYKSLTASMDHLRRITPAGAYQNEADVYEPNHEASFWGDNYRRLLKIKNKYDPNNIFTCHQCVGWKSDDSRFKCYL